MPPAARCSPFLSIRLADDYLAIVTIGFGEVVNILLLNEDWLTGGALGIANIPEADVVDHSGGPI